MPSSNPGPQAIRTISFNVWKHMDILMMILELYLLKDMQIHPYDMCPPLCDIQFSS